MLIGSDVASLCAVHREIINLLPDPELCRPAALDYLEAHIADRGRTIGAFLGTRLIAYAVVRFPNRDPDNLGADLGLIDSELPFVAHFELSGVLPRFRGKGLQFELNRARVDVSSRAGCHHVAVTVSPKNHYSLRTHFRTSIHGKALAVKYGGLVRLILHRDLRHSSPARWVDIRGVEAQQTSELKRLLELGYRAHDVSSNGSMIHFGVPEPGPLTRSLPQHRDQREGFRLAPPLSSQLNDRRSEKSRSEESSE
jgi:hypothetical protein